MEDNGMSTFWEITISASILMGAFFTLVGSYGLNKLPDLMTRLRSPRDNHTGVGAILLSPSSLLARVDSIHQRTLITFFLFGTAPISAHFITLNYLHSTCKDPVTELPDTCCQ